MNFVVVLKSNILIFPINQFHKVTDLKIGKFCHLTYIFALSLREIYDYYEELLMYMRCVKFVEFLEKLYGGYLSNHACMYNSNVC